MGGVQGEVRGEVQGEVQGACRVRAGCVQGAPGVSALWSECLVGCAAQPVCTAAATSCRALPRRDARGEGEGGGRGGQLTARIRGRASGGLGPGDTPGDTAETAISVQSRCQPRLGRFEPRPARPSVLERRARCDQSAPGGKAAARHTHRSESEQLASLVVESGKRVGTGGGILACEDTAQRCDAPGVPGATNGQRCPCR